MATTNANQRTYIYVDIYTYIDDSNSRKSYFNEYTEIEFDLNAFLTIMIIIIMIIIIIIIIIIVKKSVR